MWEFGFGVVIALVVVWISCWIYRWANPNFSGKLPPGSMGFPVIGETVAFLKNLAYHDITPFVNSRISRFGPLFRTSLFGLKVIVSTDSEVSFQIIKQENIFVFDYPSSVRRIFGKDNLFFQGGNAHKYVRKIALQFFGSESLKGRLIREMDRATREHFRKAAEDGFAEVKELATGMIIECISKKMTSEMEAEAAKELEENWKFLRLGWFQFPFSIPGTTFHKSLQARKKAISMIKEMLNNKTSSTKKSSDSFLDTMRDELEKEDSILNEERAVNLIFIFSLVSHETTSTAIRGAVKFLAKHPEVVAELKKEQERIVQNRDDPESGITWEEYKSMNFTHMVINESLRLVSSSTFMFRKTAQNVEIGGYSIPAGWYVLMLPYVHFDSKFYDDPYTFNPWRWKGKELHAGSKTFMAFGGGGRLCAGAEFAKLQMAIFLHYLVTKYSWSVEGNMDVIEGPSTQFPKRIQIRICENAN